MDESLGDSGCGDGCNNYPNSGNSFSSSSHHRSRNMPLADALDLSNRFFQQSGKPNWKRERDERNPLQKKLKILKSENLFKNFPFFANFFLYSSTHYATATLTPVKEKEEAA